MHIKSSPVLRYSLNRQQSLIQILWQTLLGANPVSILPLFLSNRTSVYLVAEMCPAEEHFPVFLASVGADMKLHGLWNCMAYGNLIEATVEGSLKALKSLPFALPNFPTRSRDALSEGQGLLCHHERDGTRGQTGKQERQEDPGFPKTS